MRTPLQVCGATNLKLAHKHLKAICQWLRPVFAHSRVQALRVGAHPRLGVGVDHCQWQSARQLEVAAGAASGDSIPPRCHGTVTRVTSLGRHGIMMHAHSASEISGLQGTCTSRTQGHTPRFAGVRRSVGKVPLRPCPCPPGRGQGSTGTGRLQPAITDGQFRVTKLFF